MAISVEFSTHGATCRAFGHVSPMAFVATTTAHSVGCRATLWAMLLATAAAGVPARGLGGTCTCLHRAGFLLVLLVLGNDTYSRWGPQSRSGRPGSFVCLAFCHSVVKCAEGVHRDEFLYQHLISDTRKDPVFDPCLLTCTAVAFEQVHVLRQALQTNVEVREAFTFRLFAVGESLFTKRLVALDFIMYL